MQISFNGMLALKEYEGFSADAYQDGGGVWTIGYGTTKLPTGPVVQGMTCTKEQAELWLHNDLAWAQTAVNQMVRVPLTQTRYDALVSFVYNEGETQFSKSTLLRKLNSGDYAGASNEFPKWVYDNGKVVHGLENRREKERKMFNT